jgi:hypothetical protein
MLNRLIGEAFDVSRQQISQSITWMASARATLRGFTIAVHRALMVLGIAAIGAIVAMFVKPEMADHLKTLSPFTVVQAAKTVESSPAVAAPLGLTTEVAAGIGNESINTDENFHQRQRVIHWISKRYRVAADATGMLVSEVYQTANDLKLDPLLVLAVMAIESRFNPFAESPVGAQGLMQVMSKVHREKFDDHGGVKAALNPVANIKVGSQILKNYVQRGGSVEAGLKLYVGAGAFDTDFGYGAKVLGEYARLKDVAMGKKVSIYATTARKSAPAKEKTEPAKTTAANEQVEPTAEADKVAAL